MGDCVPKVDMFAKSHVMLLFAYLMARILMLWDSNKICASGVPTVMGSLPIPVFMFLACGQDIIHWPMASLSNQNFI